VGFAFPYTSVRILDCTPEGKVARECAPGEVGEICVSSPGVAVGQTYTDASKNKGLYADHVWLRTGDLGRIDADGYITITGRAKDIIIRGGHNIDPAMIEEALAGHPAVAFVGAIGQPDAVAGELPCAYVELVAGAAVTVDALMDHARAHVPERAAHPKHIEILPELPKTAVGKVFKPDLRRRAITRVLNGTLAEAKLAAEVAEVVEDKRRGLVARVRRTGTVDTGAVERRLGEFAQAWDWAD
jgi:acyl-CoA synthetase (AMP-forming)/AMP-acid ligase II